jgi:hypothetical protein
MFLFGIFSIQLMNEKYLIYKNEKETYERIELENDMV